MGCLSGCLGIGRDFLEGFFRGLFSVPRETRAFLEGFFRGLPGARGERGGRGGWDTPKRIYHKNTSVQTKRGRG